MPVIVTRGAASIKSLGFAGAGKPLAPTIGTATRTSASISVPFTPGYDGGAPVTLYTVTSSPGNYIFTGSSSPITATGMTLGTDYTFTVYATNVYGDSPLSASSNSLKYASVPPAPTIGTATVTSPTSVDVTFTAPASNGGEPITQYAAVAFLGGNPIASGTLFQSGSGTISVINLTSGATYTFKVLAYNALGAGVYSNASNNATPDLPTYTFSSNMLANVGGEFAEEGLTSSFYIDTNETVTATTLYWAVSGTGITVSDFDSGSLTGSVSITPAVRSTVNLAIRSDGATEGNETFVINFYTNAARTTLLTDAVIGGYVIGNSRPVLISDTSTVSFSITPNRTSVNETTTNSVSFSVSRTDGASSTAYWNVQTMSGTINSSDFTTTGSVSISSGSGSFSITISADQTVEGTESFRVRLYSDSGRTVLVATSSTITISDTSQYIPAGTYISQYCSGYDLYYTYADGSGGTYDQLAQSNSPTCGYTPPTIAGSVTLGSNYVVFGPNYQTKADYLFFSRQGGAPTTSSWSVNGLTVQTAGAGASASSGTFNSSVQNEVVVFQGPHGAANVTLTISAPGYTSYTSTIFVPANSTYSPYTASLGFTQESGKSASVAQSVINWYAGNSSYTVTGGATRWQLYRAVEYGGLVFWCDYLTNNGLTTSSQQFRDAFGAASESVVGPKTTFERGTGWNVLSDRP